jgi:hypothetical protein
MCHLVCLTNNKRLDRPWTTESEILPAPRGRGSVRLPATVSVPVRMSTVITCRRAWSGCVVAGCGRRRGAAGGEVSSWTWGSKHHGRNLRVGEQAVIAAVIDPLWVRAGSRDIRVDSLATQLVINRRLAPGANAVGARRRGRHQHSIGGIHILKRLTRSGDAVGPPATVLSRTPCTRRRSTRPPTGLGRSGCRPTPLLR